MRIALIGYGVNTLFLMAWMVQGVWMGVFTHSVILAVIIWFDETRRITGAILG